MNRPAADFLIAGGCWGLFAALLGHRAFPHGLWVGVLVSPFIGLLVGRLMQPWFERGGRWRALAALAGLYFGSALFAIGVAVGSWPRFRLMPLTSTVETILAVWWGITITGYLLFLWPGAYFTHWLIEWRGGGTRTDA